MAKKAVIAVFALLAVLMAHSAQKQNGNKTVANLPEKEIRDLSSAIKAAATYREDMRRELEQLEDSLNSADSDLERFRLTLALSLKFRPINTDSALNYAYRSQAIALNLDQENQHKAEIAVINALATAGLFTDATELFTSLRQTKLSPQTRLDYWVAGRRLYGYMRGYAQGNKECYTKYDNLYQQYDDSLLMHLPANSAFRNFVECERLVTENKYREAQEKLEKLLQSLPQENNIYGMAAFQMAEVWRNLGDESRYAAMLALSALSDVKGCVTEGLALPMLAYWLYEQGELGYSFSFINFALEEASAGNARMRAVTIAQFVPVIDEAYQGKINSSRDEMMIYFLLVTLLLIVTGVLTVFLSKQIKKTRANARKLAQTSRRQESYIGNFIGLYSSYADKFHHLTKLVSTKLATGQVSELKKLIDSGKFSDQDNEDIHKIFDSAFLDIYPDFVADINSLLRPEEVIEIKNHGMLSPELRIYAFVKLGIEESTRIARILHYSINTVYTYRNKMRNKAVHRDTFDEDVKNLGPVDQKMLTLSGKGITSSLK